MENRVVKTLNEEEVLSNAIKASQKLFERTGICVKPETYWPII